MCCWSPRDRSGRDAHVWSEGSTGGNVVSSLWPGEATKLLACLKWNCVLTTSYPVSIWTYTFLVPEYALSFACTSPGNPHSGTVWDLEGGTEEPDWSHTGSNVFLQNQGKSPCTYMCLHIYICVFYISDKGLVVFKLRKEFLQLNKKINNSIKNSQDIWMLQQRYMDDGKHKYMKRCSTPLAIREMQTETQPHTYQNG